MNYRSTRGGVKGVGFKDAVMMGLANDGGLLLPEEIPRLSREELASLRSFSYPELALHLISRFADDIPEADLRDLVERSYASFTHPEVTPVVARDGVWILELFHGPTLAFKDVALQFLGNLFAYLLAERGEQMNIIGATSGDTGSAAIYGVQGKANINIFILHPHGRVSPVQELQMTTVTDANVHNIAVRGTFDDAQDIVKAIFNDLDFKARYNLGAVNSINWARVLAQVVYYFYACFRVQQATGASEVAFSVPSGNFGDVFAGYIARAMGLPVGRLIIGTNENNILARFVDSGDYSVGQVQASLSPSMDIQVASNFERYLYYLFNADSARLNRAMQELKEKGAITFSEAEVEQGQRDFAALSVDRQTTLETIHTFYETSGYLLDPHTAAGVRAGQSCCPQEMPLVCLATAHPAKFADAVREATGVEPPRPACLAGIEEREKRCQLLDADVAVVRAFVEKTVAGA